MNDEHRRRIALTMAVMLCLALSLSAWTSVSRPADSVVRSPSCTLPSAPHPDAPPYLHLSLSTGSFGQQFTYTIDPRLSTAGWVGWELLWDGALIYYTGGGAPVSGQGLYVPRNASPGYHVVGLYRLVPSSQGSTTRGPLAAAALFLVPGPGLCALPTPTPGPDLAGLRVADIGQNIEAIGIDTTRRHGVVINGPGAGEGDMAYLFDTRTLAVLARTPLHFVAENACCSVSVDENHGRVLFASGYSVVILDTRTGAQVLTTGAAGSAAGALAPRTGRAFVVGDNNGGTVDVFDDVRGRRLTTLSATTAEPAAIAVGDGTRVLIGGRYPIALTDPKTHRRQVTMAATEIDVRSHRIIATRPIIGEAWTGAADDRGHAFLGVTGGIAVFDLARGTQLGATQGGGLAISLAVDAPLHRVLAAEAATMVAQGTAVSAVDSRTGAAIGSVDIGFRPLSLALDTSLHRLIAVGYDAQLQQHVAIVDVTRMKVLSRRIVGEAGTQGVCFVGDPGCRPALVAIDQTLHQAYIIGADRKLYVMPLAHP